MRLRLFGGFAVEDERGRQPRLPTRKTSLLLAALALAGERGFRREALAELIWPDRAAAQARASLRQALTAVRKLLSEGGSSLAVTLPLEMLLDGSLKTGLAVAGGFTGQALGLLVFGPAGAVIFGATGGAGALLGAGHVRNAAEGYLAREWRERVEKSANMFEDALRIAILRKREILQRKLASLVADGRLERGWLRQRLKDDALALAEALAALGGLPRGREPIERVRLLLRIMHEAAVHPWTVRHELDALIEAVNAKPSLAGTTWRAAESAWKTGPGIWPRSSESG